MYYIQGQGGKEIKRGKERDRRARHRRSNTEQSRNDDVNSMFNCTRCLTPKIEREPGNRLIVTLARVYLWDCNLWCVCLAVTADLPIPSLQIISHSLHTDFTPICQFRLIAALGYRSQIMCTRTCSRAVIDRDTIDPSSALLSGNS